MRQGAWKVGLVGMVVLLMLMTSTSIKWGNGHGNHYYENLAFCQSTGLYYDCLHMGNY